MDEQKEFQTLNTEKPKISKKPAMRQTNLSWSPKQQKPAEPPPLSDDDY